jgi:hypothetical protein
MKTKTFDCVEMKRRGAEMIQERIKGKSIEQQLQYWQKGTKELRGLQEKLRRKPNRR